MKIKKPGDGGDANSVLSFDLVLALHPQESATDRASPETAANNREDPVRGAPKAAAPGAAISVAELTTEEKALLALVDGVRSVADVVRLSGMPSEKAQKQLRGLHDRGVLAAAPKVVALPDDIGPPRPEDSESGASSDGSSALTRAIDEYLELAASGLTVAAAEEPGHAPAETRLVSGATVLPDASATSALAGTIPDSAGTPGTAADAQRAADKASIEAMSARFPANLQGFRPNVTAFWIPSMAEVPPNPPSSGRDTTAPSPDSISALPGSGPSGAATVVVTGSRPLGAGVPTDTQRHEGQAIALPPPVGTDGVPRASTAQPLASAPIPFRVGNYEVATRIAQGGMGSIYVCRRAGEAGFQRLFTLKVVRQHSAKREAAVRSFKREAQVGSLLSHPNLQTVLDTGSYKDQPFLVLDYVEGTSLSELIAEDRRAPPAVAAAILLDVLRGLEHAHQLTDEKGKRLGLIHGDVSPQNVLVGVDGAARLTDFGSSTFTGEGRAHDPKWIATGKPAYMAPEQLRAEPLDARTDVFAAGVLMWSVLTGQKLFAGDSYDETIIKVLRKKIPPPSTMGAPAYFDDVCLKALSRSREGRYTSAEEMARELARVASREKALASAAEVGQWVRRESGEALGEQRRRIQFMFGISKAPPGGGQGQGQGQGIGGAGAGGSRRAAPPTIVLDSVQRGGLQSAQTPQLGAIKTLSSRTVFLPSVRRPQKTFWRTWNVVIVSALLALPVTLTIGYFVSNLLVSHPPPAPLAPAPAGADAAASQ